MTGTIQMGSRVMLHYTLCLADGHVVESTRDGQPETHVVGSGSWLAPLDERLLGLRAGDIRRFEIAAAEINIPDASAPQTMPRDDFPPEITVEPGMVISFQLPSGEEVPGTVLETSAYDVTVDFAHPLAGRDLVWELEILEVNPPQSA